jgi:hypothetical protein
MLHRPALALVRRPRAPFRFGGTHRGPEIRAGRHEQAWAALALLAAAITASPRALAAEPDVKRCLEASDASLALETGGKLLAARAALRECASSACPREINQECARRLDLIERTIPSVLCEVRDADGRRRLDARVTVNGRSPMLGADGAMELDPGSYILTVEVPGEAAESRGLTVDRGDKKQRVLVTLASGAPRAPADGAPPLPSRWQPRRTAALVVGGAGVASLAVASVFAMIALDKKEEARSNCSTDPCGSRTGVERWQEAWRAGNMATAFAFGGGLSLAAAAALWFSAGDGGSPAVGLGPAQLNLKARF